MSAYAMPGGLFPPIESTVTATPAPPAATPIQAKNGGDDKDWRIFSYNFAGGWSSVGANNGTGSGGSGGAKSSSNNSKSITQSRPTTNSASTSAEAPSTRLKHRERGLLLPGVGSTAGDIPALKSCSSSSSLNNNSNNNGHDAGTQLAWPTMMTMTIPPLQSMFGGGQQQHQQRQQQQLGSTNSESSDCGTPDREQRQHPSLHAQSVVDIAVMEAKIDPVQLVQYVTRSSFNGSGGCKNHHNLRRRNSGGSLHSSTGSGSSCSPSSSPLHTPKCTKPSLSSSSSSLAAAPSLLSSSASSTGYGAENAIEFELSINFRGRKYTCRRTMQCIIKLRDDLIREMRHKRRWLSMTGASASAQASSPSVTDACSNALNVGDADTISKGVSSSSTVYRDWRDEMYIPEIPPLMSRETDDGSVLWHDYASSSCLSSTATTSSTVMNTSPGFVGRGFTMLHHMVSSYVPVMDRWLRNVMMIVPQDSECLSNFLWEPDYSAGNYYNSFPSLVGGRGEEDSRTTTNATTTIELSSSFLPTHGSSTAGSSSTSTNLSSSSSMDLPIILKRSTSLTAVRELSAITELDYCTSDDDDDE